MTAVVEADHKILEQVASEVPRMCERKDIEMRLKHMSQHYDSELGSLREWSAGKDSVLRLHNAHSETVKRVTGMETLLSCKLDRSEISYLEGLASNFESFSKYQVATNNVLDTIQANVRRNAERIAENKSAVDQLKVSSDAIISRLHTLAPKAETRSLAKELQRLDEIMKTLSGLEPVAAVISSLLLYLPCGILTVLYFSLNGACLLRVADLK